jgi:hypothetical protein
MLQVKKKDRHCKLVIGRINQQELKKMIHDEREEEKRDKRRYMATERRQKRREKERGKNVYF